MRSAFCSLCMVPALFVVGLAPTLAAGAEEPAPKGKPCPFVVPLDQVTIEIAEVRYETDIQGVDGNRMSLRDEQRDKYRYALVTLRIRKPPGLKLTIAAADLTLHYYFGTEPEVAPAEGLSSFTVTLDAERPMKLPTQQGPGWVKQTTNPRCTEAADVYVDVVFAMVEPETREIWIGVAQPTTPSPFVCKGWGPGASQ